MGNRSQQCCAGFIARIGLASSLYATNRYGSVARLTKTALQYDPTPGFPSVFNSHTYEYNAGGQRKKETRSGGNWIDFTYDSVGQLKTAVATNMAGSIVRGHEQFRYAYDPAGNLTVRTNNALVQTFLVNDLNQLTNVSRTGTFMVAGAYAGEINDTASVTINGSAVDRVHDDKTFSKSGLTLTNGANSFTAIATETALGRKATNTVTVNLPVTVNYTYDDNGNLTSDGERSFNYDDENQLTLVEVSGSWRVLYSYDGLGRRRIRKEYTLSGSSSNLVAETWYVYDGRRVIQERDGNNIVKVKYTRGLDLSGTLEGAGGIGGLLARTDSSPVPHAFYHHDGRGNTIVMVNSQKQTVARYLYDPFGRMIGMSGALADANVYRFSGKEHDNRAGIYYYGFRFYEPNLQRWLSQDPLGEAGGLNLYGFVANNPLVFIDPLGLHWTDYIPDWVDPAGEFCAGVSDELTLGLTGYGRKAFDIDVDRTSMGYRAGGGAAAGVQMAAGIPGLVKTGAKVAAKNAVKCAAKRTNANQALRNAKDAHGVPRSAQPDRTIKPGTREGDALGLDDRNVKLYEYTNNKGEKIHIRQDKSASYGQGGMGDQGPHF